VEVVAVPDVHPDATKATTAATAAAAISATFVGPSLRTARQ
jgi:hypothetical protein